MAKLLTIGSDPEFVFLSPTTGEVLKAHELFYTSAGYTEEFGYDGDSTLAELRPHYSTNPFDHAKNIKKTLQRGKELYPELNNYLWQSSHPRTSLGGHIHFGGLSKELFEPVVNNLDFLLSLPLAFLENPQVASYRKQNQNYGKWGDFRPQPWGLEYRTPSSWLGSEKLTLQVLSLAYAIGHATLHGWKNPFNFSNFHYAMFDHHDLPQLAKFLPLLKKMTLSLPLVSDPLYHPIITSFWRDVSQKARPFETEIQWGWHLPIDFPKFFHSSTLPELSKKLAKYLLLFSPHHNQIRDFNFLQGSFGDYRIGELVSDTGSALNFLFKTELDNTSFLYLRGLKAERGNQIKISLNCPNSTLSRIEQSLTKLLPLFPPNTKFSFSPNFESTIFFGRELRKNHYFGCLALTIFIYLVLNNNTFFKSFTFNSQKGIAKKTRLYTAPLLKTLISSLADKKEVWKPLNEQDGGEPPTLTFNPEIKRRLNTAPIPLLEANWLELLSIFDVLVNSPEKEKSLNIIRLWKIWLNRKDTTDLFSALRTSVRSSSLPELKLIKQLTLGQLVVLLAKLKNEVDTIFSNLYSDIHHNQDQADFGLPTLHSNYSGQAPDELPRRRLINRILQTEVEGNQ